MLLCLVTGPVILSQLFLPEALYTVRWRVLVGTL